MGAPLVWAQHAYSSGHPWATITAAVMCGVFVLVGPFACRVLLPVGRRPRLLGLAGYGLVGALPTLVGLVIPDVIGLGATFLTGTINLAVVTALFWVGGWGLARDIDQEQALATERTRAEALAREAERAQLLAVRSHLDPHFLFNTLNAIAEWCRTDGAAAERAVLQLSGLLREMLGGLEEESWPLEREVGLVRDLWALHRARDPERFTTEYAIEAVEAHVPPLILLPLAENAVKHGPASGHTGPLRLEISGAAGRLHVSVCSPGPLGVPRPGGHGVAHVRRRLALAYGPGAELELRAAQGGTRAELDLPLKPLEAA